jgi:hypothetical protein
MTYDVGIWGRRFVSTWDSIVSKRWLMVTVIDLIRPWLNAACKSREDLVLIFIGEDT